MIGSVEKPSIGALLRHFFVIPALALMIAAFASKKEEEPYIEGTVDSLYNQGMDFLAEERFTDAAQYFNEVERQHPYSVWATKAKLMSAYAQYQNNKYDDAVTALDRFIAVQIGRAHV